MQEGTPPRPIEHEDPLVLIVWRRIVKRLKANAQTPQFGRMLVAQAAGAAGDALVAVALAGSLFFSVPTTTARGRVFLYLALTAAPFAVVSPLLARVLDRFRGSHKWAMVLSAFARGCLAWLMATRTTSLYLFPIAFGILVFSRAALIVRGAMLPGLIEHDGSLVGANASLSKISGLAGMVGGVPGLVLIKLFGPHIELLYAALVYFVGVLPALGLPKARGIRPDIETRAARAAARSQAITRSFASTAVMRLLVGYLVFHLAFAFRREHFSSLGLGGLVAAAAFGGLLGAIAAPPLRRLLKAEGMIAVSLVVAGLAGVLVGRWFSEASAMILVFAFGIAQGSGKVAFDSIVQRELPEEARGWAFARFESFLQLAWVVGGAFPLLVAIPAGPGVMAAGFAALSMAIVYLMGGRPRSAVSRLASRPAETLTQQPGSTGGGKR
ncbi:MAG: hypothetical protein M3290_07110 [Actinomycetota bacterium]|nr:hypothetical protein [Actinomycetota bacterium]